MHIIAGEQVEAWNDELWRTIRERDGVRDDFLSDPEYLEPFRSGGGKGGALLAFTKDKNFVIKEVSKRDSKILLGLANSYVERIRGGRTLLCTIYLHYTEPAKKRTYMVMRNLLRHAGPYEGLFDLKGCADDKTLISQGREVKTVHKRIWQLHLWCGKCAWSADRKTYHHGKVAAREMSILLTDEQQTSVAELLQQDTEWLATNNLMDYSLLVCTKRLTWAEFEADALARQAAQAEPGELHQPMLHHIEPDSGGKGDVMLVYIGIIDFLQSWTCGKKVAMGLKVFERNKATIPPDAYAKRFHRHFTNAISGGAVALQPLVEVDVENQRDVNSDQAFGLATTHTAVTLDVCM